MLNIIFNDYEKKITYIDLLINNIEIISKLLSISNSNFLNEDINLKTKIIKILDNIQLIINELILKKLILWNDHKHLTNPNSIEFIVSYNLDINLVNYLVDDTISLNIFFSNLLFETQIDILFKSINNIINKFNYNKEICYKYLFYKNNLRN